MPHQRRRMLFVASMHGDARDLLLATGMRPCTGACEAKFGQGAMCYRCLRAEELPVGDTSYALDMGNARCASGYRAEKLLCPVHSCGRVMAMPVQSVENVWKSASFQGCLPFRAATLAWQTWCGWNRHSCLSNSCAFTACTLPTFDALRLRIQSIRHFKR